jgi:hypothetical protein
VQYEIAGVRIRARSVPLTPNIDTASLEDHIRQLVEKEFGHLKQNRQTKAPEHSWLLAEPEAMAAS